jgi:hypothetical protein
MLKRPRKSSKRLWSDLEGAYHDRQRQIETIISSHLDEHGQSIFALMAKLISRPDSLVRFVGRRTKIGFPVAVRRVDLK